MKKILFLLLCVIGVGFSQTDTFQTSNLEAYQNDCSKKVATGCYWLGIGYFLGDGLPKDDGKAIEYINKAYELDSKNPRFSSSLARIYYYTYKTKGGQNQTEASRLFDEACSYKDAPSCDFLGDLYAFGDDAVKVDSAKANEYYKKACTLKYNASCNKIIGKKKK